jgi:sulfur-carrier protein
MAVTVRIPTVLRRLTAGRDEIPASGTTVGEVFDELGRDNAEFLARIQDGGEMKPFLNVFVNGDDIRFANGLQTPVQDGDEVSIIPSIAGGR